MAIAFDAVTEDPSSSARESATFAHTCTGSDRYLLVFAIAGDTGDENDVTSITYNGVNLVELATDGGAMTGGFIHGEVWGLAAPATGSNNVVVTYSESVPLDICVAISYTGVAQAGSTGGTGTATGASDNPSVSVTSTATDSLIVAGCAVEGGDADPFTPGANTTERWDGATGGSTTTDISYCGGDEVAATIQAYTVDFTAAVSDDWVIVAVELLQVTVAGQPTNLRATTIPGMRQWHPRIGP